MVKGWYLIFLVLFFLNHSFAENTVEYQKKLSNLSPENRLKQLEIDLNPSHIISLKQVDKWQRFQQFNKCLQDEGQYLEIEQTLLKKWAEAWETQSSHKFSELFTHRTKFYFPKVSSLSFRESYNGILIYKLLDNHKGVIKIEDSFLKSYAKVESVEIIGLKYTIDESFRAFKDLNYNQVHLDLIYDIRGLNKNRQRQNDRGVITVTLKLLEKKWFLESGQFKEGERIVSARKPAFIEKTDQSGLNKVVINERSEAIRRGGYAISIKDINQDGFLDIYSGSSKKSQLLIGNKYNKWKLSKEKGLTDLSAVKTSVFSDFDNDGDLDAIMTLFEYDRDDSDLVFLVNNKGTFTPIKGFVKGKLNYNLPMPASVADFNNDGFLDLYVGFPGKRDFTILSNEKEAFTYPQGFFLNLVGNTKSHVFIDTSKIAWGKKGLSKYTSLFPHSSLAIDYDFDGDMDLLVVDDRSNLSPFYENLDGKKFKLVNKLVNFQNKGYGMGVAVGDLDNDGINEIAMTNVNFHSRNRFHTSCNENWYFDFENDFGLKLFSGKKQKNSYRPTFTDITQASGITHVGEGVAGVEFLDYNNDGLLDIYVATGLWSGESDDKKYDLSSLFTRAVATKKTYNDVLSPYRSYRNRDWSFISILRDAKLKTTRSMAGYQRNRLFLNLGNKNFIEVGYLEGVDSIYDGYVIATADQNKDGKVDLFLRNGDPGSLKYSFPTIQFFKNQLAGENNSLTLTLEGTKSNKDAIGSIVSVKTKSGKKIIRQLVSNNGAAQSQPLLHFGLEKDHSATVVVQWPSGDIQNIGTLKKGYYIIKEGKHLSLLTDQ